MDKNTLIPPPNTRNTDENHMPQMEKVEWK